MHLIHTLLQAPRRMDQCTIESSSRAGFRETSALWLRQAPHQLLGLRIDRCWQHRPIFWACHEDGGISKISAGEILEKVPSDYHVSETFH